MSGIQLGEHMKQLKCVAKFSIVFVLYTLLTNVLLAKEIEVGLKFSFDTKKCDHAKIESRCIPWSDDLQNYNIDLRPVVPVKTIRVLLPLGEAIGDFKLFRNQTETLPYRFAITPSTEWLTRRGPVQPVQKTYQGGEYPEKWTSDVRMSRFRGYNIAEISIFPFRALDKQNAIYFTEGTFKITTIKEGKISKTYRGKKRDLDRALLYADEKETIGYLIIGSADLIGAETNGPLTKLIQDKKARGLDVRIADLHVVSPEEKPSEIRDFIRKEYKEHGVDYVLLVGDHWKLPWKKLRAGFDPNFLGDPIPSDQYYACLDGDFSDPKTYDWACEVAVGRVGVTTAKQLSDWVEKTLELQKIIKEGRTNEVLNYGQHLDLGTYGGYSLDFVVNGGGDSPSTSGFPGSINVTRLYDTDDPPTQYSGSDFVEMLNQGDFHVALHLGHSNEFDGFAMSMDDISLFSSRPAFFYSLGCYPNDPDYDNWTINAVRYPKYGPAAMIGNTRYGMYRKGESEAPSNIILRLFWESYFKGNLKTIGMMNHRSKELYTAVYRDTTAYYLALEGNLIGDPELDLGLSRK